MPTSVQTFSWAIDIRLTSLQQEKNDHLKAYVHYYERIVHSYVQTQKYVNLGRELCTHASNMPTSVQTFSKAVCLHRRHGNARQKQKRPCNAMGRFLINGMAARQDSASIGHTNILCLRRQD